MSSCTTFSRSRLKISQTLASEMITFPRECHAPVSLPPDRPLTRRLRSARNHAQRLTYSRFITHISTQIFVRALCQLGPIHFCARTHLKVGCTVSLPHAKHNCAEVKLHLCALVHQDWLADASAAPSNDFACGTHSSNRLRQLTWVMAKRDGAQEQQVTQ